MKKVIIAAAASLFAVSAYANTAFDGLYGGIAGSYGQSKAEGLKDDGFSGGIYGGYGLTFDKFYLGGEAKADFGGFKFSEDGMSAEKEYGYGVSARAGYLVNKDTLGYGIVGYERGRIEFSEAGAASKENIDGITFGAGVERMLKNNVAVRGEVTHTKWDADDVDIKETKGTIGIGIRF